MIKNLYWKLESFSFKLFADVMPIRKSNKKHSLDALLIISFTSYKPRFKTLHLTIKTLMAQTVKPDIIVLWVSSKDYEFLPKKVINLKNNHKNFKISKCDDVKSYKKLVPALKEYPDSYIVTADDDIFYPRKWLEELIGNRKSSSDIIAHRVHSVKVKNGKIARYGEWEKSVVSSSNKILFPTTGGGVLYPPNSFHSDVTNSQNFLHLCPTADDIWFFWMAKLKGTAIKYSGYNLNLVSWPGTDAGGLAEKNVGNSKNDEYIKNLSKIYGNVIQ